jgi:malonyl CoA-acyl carrier protein transacylase
MAHVAVLFPGQGSLTSDTAERTRAAWPELVARAEERMGEDPFARAGRSTACAQPAVFLASMAAWRERALPIADVCAMAGHSLGELSALAAAGVLTVDDALELVIQRGALMAGAAEAQPGGSMLALLGAEPSVAADLAERHGVALANDNAPGQVVVSGDRVLLKRLGADARRLGLRTLELDVTGAFHSPAMRPAVLPLRRAVEQAPVRAAAVPVVSGLTARPFEDLPGELAGAVTGVVRWREVMGALVALGATEFVDVGPGRVLERLVRRNLGGDRVAA